VRALVYLKNIVNEYTSSVIVKVMVKRETIRKKIAREKLVKERIDETKEKWIKKYFGGGHIL